MNEGKFKLTDDDLEQVFGGAFKGETMRYVALGGDTLPQIAQRFGTTVEVLAELNALSSNTVRAGQVLTVPNQKG